MSATATDVTAATLRYQGKVDAPEVVAGTPFLEVPAEVMAALGAGKRPKVVVTLNGYQYRSTVEVYGARFYLPVRREVREAAGVRYGEPLDVALALDTAQRTVEVPDDAAAALDADPALRATFDALSYSHRKEYVDWIVEAAKPETRVRRAAKSVTMLAEEIGK